MNAKLICVKENTCVRPVIESGLLEELIDQFCDLPRRVLMAVVAERQRSTTPKPREREKRQLRRLEILVDVVFALILWRVFALIPKPSDVGYCGGGPGRPPTGMSFCG